MKRFLLKRVSDKDKSPVTCGVLLCESGDTYEPFALTLEKPWKGNQQSISCIPDGEYICRRVNSPKFGNTFEITGVKGRLAILLHKGNIEEHTHGCVLIGEQFGYLNGETAVLSSDTGFTEFLNKAKDINDFLLSIKWV